MMRIKELEWVPFSLIFRLNIVIQDPYQADEIVMEIEDVYGKCVLEISIVS